MHGFCNGHLEYLALARGCARGHDDRLARTGEVDAFRLMRPETIGWLEVLEFWSEGSGELGVARLACRERLAMYEAPGVVESLNEVSDRGGCGDDRHGSQATGMGLVERVFARGCLSRLAYGTHIEAFRADGSS